jgi:predicted dehydrogenase
MAPAGAGGDDAAHRPEEDPMPLTETTRRAFLGALAAGSLLPAVRALPVRVPRRRRDKLNLGVIGVGGRGNDNLGGVAQENIVALCDVDARPLEAAAKRFPAARTFVDFRELLALGDLDAVVISTPDHTHAPIAAAALRRGLDVYCEKPLAHSVHEVRVLTQLAGEHGAVTQMGTQIHSWPNYRRVVEHVQSGALGAVTEVHVFCNGKTWSGGERPAEQPPVPEWLAWDLWLGPAPERPYHPAYHPAGWRRWWDFGGGTLGDMACHYMDLAFWALDLAHPLSVQASGPEVHPETAPAGMSVHYEFPARGKLPALALTWYDGDERPAVLERLGLQQWQNGVLFLGEDGRWLVADYDRLEIGPKERFAAFVAPPQFVPDSIGHYEEWLQACRTRGRTTCPFAYSGPLTEAVLLGNVSFRLGGTKLDWDAHAMRARNAPQAAPLLRREYREGWVL